MKVAKHGSETKIDLGNDSIAPRARESKFVVPKPGDVVTTNADPSKVKAIETRNEQALRDMEMHKSYPAVGGAYEIKSGKHVAIDGPAKASADDAERSRIDAES